MRRETIEKRGDSRDHSGQWRHKYFYYVLYHQNPYDFITIIIYNSKNYFKGKTSKFKKKASQGIDNKPTVNGCCLGLVIALHCNYICVDFACLPNSFAQS